MPWPAPGTPFASIIIVLAGQQEDLPMTVQTLVILAIGAVVLTFLGWMLRSYAKQRGPRVITCP